MIKEEFKCNFTGEKTINRYKRNFNKLKILQEMIPIKNNQKRNPALLSKNALNYLRNHKFSINKTLGTVLNVKILF